MGGVSFLSVWFQAVCWLAFPLFACAEAVRVATFNLQNYLIMDRMVDGKWKRDYPKPEKEKRALRSILKKIDADVVAFQEMGERHKGFKAFRPHHKIAHFRRRPQKAWTRRGCNVVEKG